MLVSVRSQEALSTPPHAQTRPPCVSLPNLAIVRSRSSRDCSAEGVGVVWMLATRGASVDQCVVEDAETEGAGEAG